MQNIKKATKFIYEMMIREKHLDTFGHVNNAVYLEILEEARWEFITQNGFGLKDIQKLAIGPVILEIENLKFIKELKLREKIKIETQCVYAKNKICHIAHEIKNEKDEVCTTALFILAFFDLKARKIISQPPEWLMAIGVELNS